MNLVKTLILKLVQQAMGYKVRWSKAEKELLSRYEDYIEAKNV